MNTKNSCYTYFRIVGKFDPDDVSAFVYVENQMRKPRQTFKNLSGLSLCLLRIKFCLGRFLKKLRKAYSLGSCVTQKSALIISQRTILFNRQALTSVSSFAYFSFKKSRARPHKNKQVPATHIPIPTYCCQVSLSLKTISPARLEKTILPPVTSGYVTPASRFAAPIS